MLTTFTLGVAGTAKNTGKTTTAAAIMQELRNRGQVLYITSIGYDGENIDNVTGLPKPKLQVEPPDVVATAERCIAASTAKLETIAETGMYTSLGQILIARVIRRGLVVVAGPNKSDELRKLKAMLYCLVPGVLIVDGALNRMSPMSQTDGFILATGAARSANLDCLARETGLLCNICSISQIQYAEELAKRQIKQVTLLDESMKELAVWPNSSLFSMADVAAVLSYPIRDGYYLFIPGTIGENALQDLYRHWARRQRRFTLIFADCINLLVAAQSIEYCRLMIQLKKMGVSIGVLKRTPLLAVTVNPFYPEYRFHYQDYRPAFVDFVQLQNAIRSSVNVPVYNVIQQGVRELVDQILTDFVVRMIQ